jgi:hypothetical protein
MFRKNDEHRQPPLLSPVRALPEKQRQRLERSWADVFYHDFFSRLDETIFAVVYSEEASRPNIPVNVMVALEFLKAGHGWSDEEMYDQFQFNLQVRYALGLHDFDTGNFELRSVYNFRRRLSEYQKQTGTDLLAQSFASVTDEQLRAYGVQTTEQRMDSSQIGSAMADASRLQLVVTAVQRLAGLLDVEQQTRYAAMLAPYCSEKAVRLVYRVKGKAATVAALQAAGTALAELLPIVATGEAGSKAETTHQAVARLFDENFSLSDEQTVQVKGNDEITAGALQSLDDLEATYHRKGGAAYKGYVVNETETCDSRNEFQLITHVQVAPNNTNDATLLCAAIPVLDQRTDVSDLYTDGGYGSPEADLLLRAHGIALHQTHLRGKAPDPNRYCLADFTFDFNDDGDPTYLGCPHGQIVPVLPSRSTGFIAQFDAARCQVCPAYQNQCRVRLLKKRPLCQLNFTLAQVLWAIRRQRHRHLRQRSDNPRAAIEATVRTIKHPSRGRLPVRGLRRVTDMLIGAAAMANVRTILRFRRRKRKPRLAEQTQKWHIADQADLQMWWDYIQAFFLSLSSLARPHAFAT